MTHTWQILNSSFETSLISFKDELLNNFKLLDTKLSEYGNKINELEQYENKINALERYGDKINELENSTKRIDAQIQTFGTSITSLTGRIETAEAEISTITTDSPANVTDSLENFETEQKRNKLFLKLLNKEKDNTNENVLKHDTKLKQLDEENKKHLEYNKQINSDQIALAKQVNKVAKQKVELTEFHDFTETTVNKFSEIDGALHKFGQEFFLELSNRMQSIEDSNRKRKRSVSFDDKAKKPMDIEYQVETILELGYNVVNGKFKYQVEWEEKVYPPSWQYEKDVLRTPAKCFENIIKYNRVCITCGQTFTSPVGQSKFHNSTKRCTTPNVKDVTVLSKKLRDVKNELATEKGKTFNCKKCKSTSNKKNMSTHKCSDENIITMLDSCDRCKEEFGSKMELEEHMKTHEELKCKECEFTHRSKEKFDMHQKDNHTQIVKKCPICRKPLGEGQHTCQMELEDLEVLTAEEENSLKDVSLNDLTTESNVKS